MECGPVCTSTCEKNGINQVCKKDCLEGCYCPPNTAFSNGKCVQIDECHCEHNGHQYNHGEQIHSNCDQW